MNDNTVQKENSILITAVFAEDATLLKGDRTGIRWVELDLLVDQDVTLNRFLVSLELCMQEVLSREFGLSIDPETYALAYAPKEKTDPFGSGLLREEPIRVMGLREPWYYISMDRNKIDINALECELKDPMDLHGIHDSNRGYGFLKNREDARTEWILCHRVFRDCMRNYISQSETPLKYTAERLRTTVKKETCPAIILFDNRPNRPMGKWGSAQVLQKDIHGNQTLADLGLNTSTKLFFDPLASPQSMNISSGRYECIIPRTVDDPSGETPFAHREPEKPRNFHIHNWFNTPAYVHRRAAWRKFIRLSLFILLGLIIICVMSFCLSDEVWESEAFHVFSGGVIALVLAALGFVGINCVAEQKEETHYYLEYQDYIRSILMDIYEENATLASHMKDRYPPSYAPKGDSLCNRLEDPYAFKEHLRDRSSPDYMTFNIGTTCFGSRLVRSPVKITVDADGFERSNVFFKNFQQQNRDYFRIIRIFDRKIRRRNSLDNGFYPLSELPSTIKEEYATMVGAPARCKLTPGTGIGIVMKDPDQVYDGYLDNILLDLCYHHSPDDLQILYFGAATDDRELIRDRIRNFKYLPHFRGLFSDRSQFVFSDSGARLCLDHLEQRLREWEEGEEGEEHPHVLCIFEDTYGFRDHLVGSRILKKEDPHCSGIFFARNVKDLDPCCIRLLLGVESGTWHFLNRKKNGYSLPHLSNTYIPDPFGRTQGDPRNIAVRKAFEAIALRFSPTVKHPVGRLYGSLPELLRIYRGESLVGEDKNPDHLFTSIADPESIYRDLQTYMEENWLKSRIGELEDGVSIPLGFYKDLYMPLRFSNFGDGEHALIKVPAAGREICIHTLYTALSIFYPPERVILLSLTDIFRGRGEYLSWLPNAMNAVSPSVSEENIPARQMSMLQTLLGEKEYRRKLLFDQHLSNIDDYNNKLRSISTYEKGEHRDMVAFGKEELPHIFLYADLTDASVCQHLVHEESNTVLDVDRILSSLAEMGSGMGIHLIVARDPDSDRGLCLEEWMPIQICASSLPEECGDGAERSSPRSFAVDVKKGKQGLFTNVVLADPAEPVRDPTELPCPLTLLLPDDLYRIYVSGENHDCSGTTEDEKLIRFRKNLVSTPFVRLDRERVRIASSVWNTEADLRPIYDIQSADNRPEDPDPLEQEYETKASYFGTCDRIRESKPTQGLLAVAAVNDLYCKEFMQHHP